MKTKRRHKLHEWQQRTQAGEGKCSICGDTRLLTVDHIVPASFLMAFETDVELHMNMEENFQVLCKYHNQMKASRIDAKDPRTYAIIRKVLDDAEKFHLKT